MTDSLVGFQLDEYRLEALLGRGNMARVYLAMDTRLKRRAAIKVIDAQFQHDADYIVRFEREAQAIAQLDHPHIVKIYRYGEYKGAPYMAMQYVEGADLAAMLAVYRKNGQTLNATEAVQIVREICLALDYAHAKGVIHRDIKPHNIMLDKQGNVILADFGLVLLTDVGTRGEIFGSPHYIAPEQAISSANVVPQSDLYAVGIILYEMFTGRVPFTSGSPMEIAMQHVTAPPPPPRSLRQDISEALEDTILKAIAKKPDQRYASGAALTEALARALNVGGVPKATRAKAVKTASRAGTDKSGTVREPGGETDAGRNTVFLQEQAAPAPNGPAPEAVPPAPSRKSRAKAVPVPAKDDAPPAARKPQGWVESVTDAPEPVSAEPPAASTAKTAPLSPDRLKARETPPASAEPPLPEPDILIGPEPPAPPSDSKPTAPEPVSAAPPASEPTPPARRGLFGVRRK